jgi:hypothetical protein
MNPEKDNSVNTPGNTTHGTGSLTPDAGVDTARADYSGAGTPSILHPEASKSGEQADLNDSRHDFNNADEPIPEPSTGDQNENIVDRQLGIIGRVSG